MSDKPTKVPVIGDRITGTGGYKVVHATQRSPERWMVLASDGFNWVVWRNMRHHDGEDSNIPKGWHAGQGHYFEGDALRAMEYYVPEARAVKV